MAVFNKILTRQGSGNMLFARKFFHHSTLSQVKNFVLNTE